MQLLSFDDFKARTQMPLKVVEEVEARSPGFTDLQLQMVSARVYSQLSKRYAPFDASNVPDVVVLWIIQLVTMALWLRRGFSPTDSEAEMYVKDRDTALSEIAAASNSETGLFDIPLADLSSGISKGRPRSYSETSPYAWRSKQSQIGREEDNRGGGTKR